LRNPAELVAEAPTHVQAATMLQHILVVRCSNELSPTESHSTHERCAST